MKSSSAILLAEDSEADVILVQKALKLAHIENPLFLVRNGDEAIAYLSGVGVYADRSKYPLPGLLFLDLYMPVKNGFEVLAWVRQRPELQSMRVLVLTASNKITDARQAYQMGANSFLVKPFDFENVLEFSRLLQAHWPRETTVPPASPPLDAAA